MLDMLRGHPQFFRRAAADDFRAVCLTSLWAGETYGFHVDGAVRQNGEAGLDAH